MRPVNTEEFYCTRIADLIKTITNLNEHIKLHRDKITELEKTISEQQKIIDAIFTDVTDKSLEEAIIEGEKNG